MAGRNIFGGEIIMKKRISILVLSALVTTGAFAFDIDIPELTMSAGGGLQFGAHFHTGDWDFYDPMIGFGLFGFFDATFVEASLSLGWGFGGFTIPIIDEDVNFNQMNLGISLLGKFPFDMGLFTVFPLVGFGFNIPLVQWVDGDSVDDTWNSNFVLSFGAGLDFFLTNELFIRPSLLFDINFRPFGSDFEDASRVMSVGPRLRIAAGFRF